MAISYQHVWSPLAEFILKYIPENWAPNVITIVGFLINGLGTLVLYAQTPHTSPVVPWTLLVYSFCVFAYQTLDNVDGKQARKTKNSTPLGMLLDHGCDAFGLLFLCAGVGRIIYFTDEKLYLWIFLVGITFCFYISAWCQYYSNGIMVLGPVNAVDDGIPIVWMLGVFTFFL
jgi:phosphatidylglycerophosphate synthase